MTTELQAAVLGALVGGIAGYAASALHNWLDRRRVRCAMASILLLELRGAEYLLHRFAMDLDNLTGDFQTEHFDNLDPILLADDSQSARLALDFKYRLDEIRTLRVRQVSAPTSQRRDRIKGKLVVAAQRVHDLKESLLASGGALPDPEDYQEF